jgi:hypothetical protein
VVLPACLDLPCTISTAAWDDNMRLFPFGNDHHLDWIGNLGSCFPQTTQGYILGWVAQIDEY